MAVTAGAYAFFLSSKGKRPHSIWKAITPAAQRSEAGIHSERSVSGAMYQGVCERCAKG